MYVAFIICLSIVSALCVEKSLKPILSTGVQIDCISRALTSFPPWIPASGIKYPDILMRHKPLVEKGEGVEPTTTTSSNHCNFFFRCMNYSDLLMCHRTFFFFVQKTEGGVGWNLWIPMITGWGPVSHSSFFFSNKNNGLATHYEIKVLDSTQNIRAQNTFLSGKSEIGGLKPSEILHTFLHFHFFF